jgi:hypothetical protein
MRTRPGTRIPTVALAIAAALAATGCGSDTIRTGRSPVYLIVDRIEGASGADDNKWGTELLSDVETLRKQTVDGKEVRVPTYYPDPGRAVLRIAMKDIGGAGSPTAPSTNNFVTVTRYRVTYRRTDGRNAPGVDVPHPFEGGVTGTIGSTSSSPLGFTLVRLQAKFEPPLIGMRDGGSVATSTIADVTFYGRDQVGNDIEAGGTISVTFANWADPDN